MILGPYLLLLLLLAIVLQWKLVNHFAIPQHCKWIEVFCCWGFKMVVQVVGKIELRLTEGETDLVVEVNGMDNIDIGIEDNEGNIEYMVDFLCKALPNPVSKIGFEIGIEMTKVAKAKVFANYFEIIVHNPEIVHKVIASYWVDEVAMVLLELDSLHYHFFKLSLTLVMKGKL